MTTELVKPDAADLLEYAASLIEEWGHNKSRYIGPDGAMCESGALYVATGALRMTDNDSYYSGVFIYSDIWGAARKAYQALQNVGGGISHNDLHTTNQAIAAAKLREAAQYAKDHANVSY